MGDCAYDWCDWCNSYVDIDIGFYIVGYHKRMCYDCASEEKNRKWVDIGKRFQARCMEEQNKMLKNRVPSKRTDGECPF